MNQQNSFKIIGSGTNVAVNQWQLLLQNVHFFFVFKIKSITNGLVTAIGIELKSNRMRLKGQMIYVPETDLVLFLCSPSVLNLDDLNRRGLFLSDIPLHDATRDLILLSEQFEAEYKLTKNLEILTDKLQQTYRELEDEKRKTDRFVIR